MDQRRHDLLAAQGYAVRNLLQHAAAGAGVTVDEVVTAGLHRDGAKQEAADVARELETLHPGLFSPLAKTWPYTCTYCRGDFDKLRSCLFCTKQGCGTCVTPDGCPSCAEERKRKVAERRALSDKAAAP